MQDYPEKKLSVNHHIFLDSVDASHPEYARDRDIMDRIPHYPPLLKKTLDPLEYHEKRIIDEGRSSV
jgi:hypothetical protein